MTLPADKAPWPPKSDTTRYRRMVVNSTWYGGDPRALAALYGAQPTNRTQKQTGLAALVGFVHDWFWGTSDPAERDGKVHLPVAQSIATRSSELLFAQAPKFTVQPIEFDDNGDPTPAHKAEVAKAQDRLDYLLDKMGFQATLLAAGETCAALGSVGLRIAYDQQVLKNGPVISREDADGMLTEWRYGQVAQVTFWTVVGRKDADVWRHLEVHTPGQIEHALYLGTNDNLGERRSLDAQQATMWVFTATNGTGILNTPQGSMLAAAVPNMLPDPQDRASLAGRSDYTPGVLTLFDSIDRTVTSLMQDVEDGKSRLLVAESLLENLGTGNGVGFNNAQHLFTTLAMPTPEDPTGKLPIESVQFKIRVEEHLKTLDWLVTRAHHAAGYNTDAETGEGGADMTATEYQGRAKRDLSTRAKKARYWQAQLEPLLTTLLVVDADVYRSGIRPLPVIMEMAQPTAPSDKAQAEVVELWERGKAASLRTKVAQLHPDWSDDMVDAEVELIQGEGALADPDATLGPMVPGGPLDAEPEAEPVAEPVT